MNQLMHNLAKALSISLLVVTAAAAGNGEFRSKHGGPGNFDRMAQELELSDEQSAKVQSIMQEQRQQMQAFRKGGNRPSREEMQAHRAAMDDALSQVLTKDQLARFQKMRSRRGLRGNHRDGQKGTEEASGH